MENITYTVESNTLVIKVDLSKEGKPSATGKTLLVASSRGSTKVDYAKRPISFSLNVMAAR